MRAWQVKLFFVTPIKGLVNEIHRRFITFCFRLKITFLNTVYTNLEICQVLSLLPQKRLYNRGYCRCGGMVDALDSKSSIRKDVEVRVLSPAQYEKDHCRLWADGYRKK
jgi:hypothetical protein